MKTYLVGGAVRDILLGVKPKDKDWVVVGATERQMLDKGFIKVPASFAVFIDPKTKQEYALARAEKKVSQGYHGFETDISSNISLEDDLSRRDLTINSMAMDQNNQIIDPFNGQKDIQNRVLRHTSKAFIEDPLRVIRLARFKAQLNEHGFTIAPATVKLAQQIANSEELNHLTIERLHIEFIKALNNPRIFFETLQELNSLSKTFPIVERALDNMPDKNFFTSNCYVDCDDNQKITLCFINVGLTNLDVLKNQLHLTNNQFKLLKATITIKKISENILVDPQIILNQIKQANLLRDQALFNDSFDIYMKYLFETSKDNKDALMLKKMIDIINNLDIKSLIQNTAKDKISETINKLHLDSISKQQKNML